MGQKEKVAKESDICGKDLQLILTSTSEVIVNNSQEFNTDALQKAAVNKSQEIDSVGTSLKPLQKKKGCETIL